MQLHASDLKELLSKAKEGFTYEVEAEDTKSNCAKEGKCTVQISEQGVQERRDWRIHEDVQQDLQQPADAENHPHKTKETFQPEGDDSYSPGVVRVCALQQPEQTVVWLPLQQHQLLLTWARKNINGTTCNSGVERAAVITPVCV